MPYSDAQRQREYNQQRQGTERYKRQRCERMWRLRKVPMDLTAYDALEAKQSGKCAICGRLPRKRRLAADHDHSTNTPRGLLCVRCNLALGWYEVYSTDIMAYLADHAHKGSP